MSLDAMFNPESVAVFGSASEGKLANILVNRILDGGMKKVFIVNPKSQSVRTAAGYKSVKEIADKVDMAVIAAPASAVEGIMEECGQKKVKAAVIISSGFSEAGNIKGEEKVIEAARKYGIRLIGPNCAGMINTHANLVATLETMPPKGGISIISQSGAVGGSFMALSAEDGVGVAKFLSYGNGGDLTVIDLMKYLAEDDDTQVIALYLETVNEGREFMETVKKVSKVKPVVVVKSGRTSTGQRAALSHTGSMAGSDTVFDAALRQCGAIRVETLQDLFELCKAFSLLPEMNGRELAVITNSGGPGVMSTDRAEVDGLKITEPDDKLKKELSQFLPTFAGLRNPIDLTVEATGQQYGKAVEIALKKADAALVLYIGTPYLKSMPVAMAIAEAYKAAAKPVVAVLQVGSDIVESIAYLREHGIPCFPSGERAVSALALMAKYYEYKKNADDRHCFESVESRLPLFRDKDRLLEPEAMELLRKNNIPTPDICFVNSEDEAVEAAEHLGYPVAMKVVSPEIIHKSDCGGVILNINSRQEVEDSFRKMAVLAEKKSFQGVILTGMQKPGQEVIFGIMNDNQFGAVVAFGMGGIYTEVLKDITFRIAPISPDEAKKMITEIKMYPVLKGIRGGKGVKLDEMARALSQFSKLPFYYKDIEEADLNPVFAYEDSICVVDARILGKQK